LGVQLYQVAVAMTTNESANANRYAYMNANNNQNGLISNLAVGAIGGTEGSDGPSAGVEVATDGGGHGHHHHGHSHGGNSSSFCPCLQLVAGARALHKARNRLGSLSKGNVFDHGCWNNCLDFWTENTEGKHGSVNYYELYNTHQLDHRSSSGATSSLRTFQQTMDV
jgi:hypothetical protein